MDPGDVCVQRKKLQLWAQQGDGCLKQKRLTLKLPEMGGGMYTVIPYTTLSFPQKIIKHTKRKTKTKQTKKRTKRKTV